MMLDPRVPADEVDRLNIEIKRLSDRIAVLEAPSGTQRVAATAQLQRTVGYLASLVTKATTADTFATGSVAKDGVDHWFANPGGMGNIVIDAPTGKLVVECSAGEASVAPNGGFLVAYTSFKITDANGQPVNNYFFGTRTGRVYTNQRLGIGVTTGAVAVYFDASATPGPITITPAVGVWVDTNATGAASVTFNTINLRAQVVGDGVPAS